MEEENLKQMIEKAKKEAAGDETRQFVADFEAWIDLRNASVLPENGEEHKERLAKAHRQFMQSFARAALYHGINLEALRKQIEARKDFIPSCEVEPGRSLSKKFRNQKNVRV